MAILPSNPFAFNLALLDTSDFYVEYLLRVYWILNSQLALMAQIQGAGVAPVPDMTSLEVVKVAGVVVVKPGLAGVFSQDHGTLCAALLAQTPVADLVSGQTNYVHLVAIFDGDSSDDTEGVIRDTRLDGLGEVLVSEDDSVDGGILLAEITPSGTIVDARSFLDIAQILQRLTQLETDLGYDTGARAKGTVADRLDTLETPVVIGGGDSSDGFTVAMYNALVAQIQALQAQVLALQNASGSESPIAVRLQGRVEALRAEHSRLAAASIRNSPRVASALRSAVVVTGLSGMAEKFVDGTSKAAEYIGGNLKIDRKNRVLV